MYEKRFRAERRKNQRWQQSKAGLQGHIRQLETVVLPAACKAAAEAESFKKETSQGLRDAIEQVAHLRRQLHEVRRRNSVLWARVWRAPQIRSHAVEKARLRAKQWKMKVKGTYSKGARVMARTLVESGCSEEKAGAVIKAIAKSMGYQVKDSEVMSRHTVGRAIQEGGIASQLQLVDEWRGANGLVLSSDGTLHRHENYEAHCVSYLAPQSYSKGADVPLIPTTRMLGVHTTSDHSSKTQFDSWKQSVGDLCEVYNQSPIASSSGTVVREVDFAAKVTGMNSDHAEDQKKLARYIQDWSQSASRFLLGEKALDAKTSDEIVLLVAGALLQKISAVGGQLVWESMSEEDQLKHSAEMLTELKTTIGSEVYEALPEAQKRELNLFIWVGCCMHKEMNSVKGGNTAMTGWWAAHGILGPILLPNKFNTANLAHLSNPSDSTEPSEKRALNGSMFGGVKVAALAGLLFNHKDNKKGLQDTYVLWFRKILGISHYFPDTSNTRFQSHCAAAIVLILYLKEHIQFLEMVRDAKKDNSGFTNIEKNLYSALHDPATLTELAVLALYAQVISHPYMQVVRGGGVASVNALDLGPLHRDVRDHLQKIIEDPDLLLSPSTTHQAACLHGEEWESPAVIARIHEMAPELPHLRAVLIAFCEGAQKTWERFSSEFIEGGSIHQATAEERERVHAPATNDACEGALGSARLMMRDKPNLSERKRNAIYMHQRNNTGAYMETLRLHFVNHDYLRRSARKQDSSGLECIRRSELVDARQRTADEQRIKAGERQKKRNDRAARLDSVNFILTEAGLDALTGKVVEQLHLQADKWLASKLRHLITKKKKDMKSKSALLAELKEVIGRYSALPECDRLLILQSPAVSTNAPGTYEAVLDDDTPDDVELEYESDLG
ncbi:hypothetical protein GLOTRDRAFT_40296 [Gloeophyllum trabeum ATCC 11539]|uniref:Uncharacterized protein n=1 Tax=Gloeophyllum trabeum (strain ATCC 11539 / FP-39264 / Madison 617) TaxID=670483 RepID=S7QB55_GLOTA|nr:uncharacterized protein GLOTRDRAFT_40296 [Gloeophyllum trabeum ATCC 11539]EPQ56563.1 hypothetical protein GLOTRDRAFT_40296 [Gloeophyllum trabeum ATCC 11539]